MIGCCVVVVKEWLGMVELGHRVWTVQVPMATEEVAVTEGKEDEATASEGCKD